MKEKSEELGIPFNDDKAEEFIRFKCKGCGYEEKISADIVDESYTEEEFDKETGSPIFICIECEGNMIIKKDEV
jgi:DNA-directed RNA polymerase subunit M/transcription elongation factor TFIIS